MARFPPRARPATVLAAVVLAVVALSTFGALQVPRPNGPNDYNLAAWEIRHVSGKWIYLARHLFGRPSAEQQQRDVERFFGLVQEIATLDRTVVDPRADQATQDQAEAQLQADRQERDHLRAGVEATLEGRLTKVLEQQGLERKPPLLPGPHLVWPPVDMAFDSPPRVLAISPRDRIQLKQTRLVSGSITVEEAQALEDRYQQQNLSALVAGISGIGTYPVMVPPDQGYSDTLELLSHEWTHNYLAFRPLGIRYFSSTDLSTINETVADLAGRELGSLMAQEFPMPEPATPSPATATPGATTPATPTPAQSQPPFDPDALLRQTRQDVEALLAQGQIDQAEALMEQRREELVDHGYYIRKLNQAYFAFHGQYADTGASIDPIGPMVQEVRDRSKDIGDFLRRVSTVTSRSDLERLVQELRSQQGAG